MMASLEKNTEVSFTLLSFMHWSEVSTARSFTLNRGIVTDIMPATPLEPGWYAVHSTQSRL